MDPGPESHESRPITPPRDPNLITLPPYTPLTPLRKRAQYQKEPNDPENTPIREVNLAAGASIIVRGVGASKKNSNPVQLLNVAITKIRLVNKGLPPVAVKPFNSRSDWTTTCYVHIEPSAKSNSSEPRADLLIKWMAELAAYDSKWDVAWTPAKYGQDKRMWIRFPDLVAPIKQEEAKEKVLAWAEKRKIMVCTSYCNKGGVTLNLAAPHDVNQVLEQGHVDITGLKDTRQRVQGGRQIEIENPFELIVLGSALSEYEGLDELIKKWADDEFLVDEESTLAGIRQPPNEREATVFHMTSWASTAAVLSVAGQTSFNDNFGKYNLLAPQLLHKVNTDAAYRVPGSIREDFSKGAESMNKNLLSITRRLDEMEQQNKQQHQMTQLQLAAVTTSLTTMTNSVANLEDRVAKTQHALLAQSREVGLARNIADNSINALTLQMHIMLGTDPAVMKKQVELLEKMQAKGTELANTMENAAADFQSLISSAPIPQIMSAPQITTAPATNTPGSPSGTKRTTSKRATAASNAISAQEDPASKKRRLNNQGLGGQGDDDMEMDAQREESSVRRAHIPSPDRVKIAAHDGISVSVMYKPKPRSGKSMAAYAFHGVLDKLRDLSTYRHRSHFVPCVVPAQNTNLLSTWLMLMMALVLVSTAQMANPTTTTSTLSIYALNANGLVQPVKLSHINNVINARKPHVFVIGETKTQSKLSKSLPYQDYDIYEEPGVRCEGHHIFKWGIVMGIRKDVQIINRPALVKESFKGRVLVLDVVLPHSAGNHTPHRLIGTYAPWDPGNDDGSRPFWADMTELCNATNTSWTVAGDLNATVSPRERPTGGQQARSQFLNFLDKTRGHDLWSDNEDRTRRNDWTCRSSQAGRSGEGNIIDRVVTSSTDMVSSEIYVTDKYDDWIPSTDHRGIMARINYAFHEHSNTANHAYNSSQDFIRKASSKPRIKIPTKKEKDKYQTFQEAVDIMIKDKSLNLRSILDDDSFIQQYTDLTEVINTAASNIFGHRKPFKPPKVAIINRTIQIVMCQIRTIGGAILFEKSNQTHHVSERARGYHSEAHHAYEMTKESPDCLPSFHHFLHNERKKLHKTLYAEKAKEIMLRARDSDKKRIWTGLNGSTKQMIQSSNFVPLPFVLNDLDSPDKLVCAVTIGIFLKVGSIDMHMYLNKKIYLNTIILTSAILKYLYSKERTTILKNNRSTGTLL